MSEVLKGAVGLAVKGGPKVKNDKDDILLVRRILRANGYAVEETGGISKPDILKALVAAAKKANIDQASAYIAPNSPLMKALKPKYEQAKKRGDVGGTTEKVMMQKVKHGSQELLFLPRDYLTAKEKLFRSLERYSNQLVKSQNLNMKAYLQYSSAWANNNGMLEAFAQVVTIKAGRVKPPNKALAEAANKAVLALATTMGARNIGKLEADLKQAERSVNAFSADIDRFLKDFTGAAGGVAMSLSVTSAVGFAIVGGMAAPALFAATTLTAAQATVASAGSVAVVASLSSDLGKVTAKQKITLYEAVNNATIDGLVAIATAGIASKLPPNFTKGIAEKLAPRLAHSIAGVSGQQLTPYLTRFLTGAGDEACKAAIGQSMETFGKVIKTGGKAPSKKDFEESVGKVLLSGFGGGLMKDLSSFNENWTKQATKDIEGKLVPDLLKKLVKGNDLNAQQKAEIAKEMSDKFSEEVIKTGLTAYLKIGTGKENPKQMTAIAAKSALDNPALKKKLAAALEAEIKKKKAKKK
ncbi:hypothetical protein EGN72_11125 [Pseudorhodobacter sp. E13]|uniref:hypothetical protein n=1 Tax=Pseudorhodobacter sp. E13 TaxID=2487931 RepID=UPI000F8F74F0|nr:hypothetical protein [Pseudorhodobacter sp. E13]RUS59850.1 hypothetical protein EGN72_11125 [Pseudorhodobacter sp. E13]